MAHELLDTVRAVLATAGYGPDSGLHLHEHAYGVIVTWPAGHLVQTTIRAHATDTNPAALVGLSHGPAAVATALGTVLRQAGLSAVPHPDGFVLTTRPTVNPARPQARRSTASVGKS